MIEYKEEQIPFICVNYNSYEETLKYIDNVMSLSPRTLVIIVDNSPIEESFINIRNYLENNQLGQRVKLLRRDNRGYFQGLNEGIIYAKEKLSIHSSFYIVGNNDITFKSDFVENLHKISLDEKDLVLAPDIITTDGIHENPHVLTKMGFLRKLKYKIYFSNYTVAKLLARIKNPNQRPAKVYDPQRKKIYMGIGALYVLTPQFFYHFEKLTEEVFLYGEEAVFAGQVHSVGGHIIYEPSLVCYHNESSTTRNMESKNKYEIIRKSYKIYKKYL